jgi:putative transposase
VRKGVHAARRYSWRGPPSRSRRRTLPRRSLPATITPAGWSGACSFSARCGDAGCSAGRRSEGSARDGGARRSAASPRLVTQQARNLLLALGEQGRQLRFLVRDRDAKFSRSFDDVFRSEGTQVLMAPVQAPKANAYAERWVRTVRGDCLDWLLIVGRRHLEQTLRIYVQHYNRHRRTGRSGCRPPDQPSDQSSPARISRPGSTDATCSVVSCMSTGKLHERICTLRAGVDLARHVLSRGEDRLDGACQVVLAQCGRRVLDGGDGRGDRLWTQPACTDELEYLRDDDARVHPRDVHRDVVPV